MKPIKTEVGNRIKQIRENGNYSMNDFGKLLNNSSRGAVNNWEKGKRMPSKEVLEKIAVLGNTTIEKLLYGDMREYLFQLAKQNLGIEMNDQMIMMILFSGSFCKLSYQNELEWLELISKMIKRADYLPTHLVYMPVLGIDNLYTAHVKIPEKIEQSADKGKVIPIFYVFVDKAENILHIIPFPFNTNAEKLFYQGLDDRVLSGSDGYLTKNYEEIKFEKENSRLIFYGIDEELLKEKYQMYQYDKIKECYSEIEIITDNLYNPFVEETKKEILKIRERFT